MATPNSNVSDVGFVALCLKHVFNGKTFNSIQDLETQICNMDRKNGFNVFENDERSVSCALQPYVVATCQTGDMYKRAKNQRRRKKDGVFVLPVEDTGKVVVACFN